MENLDQRTVVRWFLGIGILLWAIHLSPDPMNTLRDPSPTSTTRSTNDAPGKVRVAGQIANRDVPRLNRKEFLERFERLAGQALMPCLLDNLGPQGSFSFFARLHKTGRLTAVRTLVDKDRLPECAIPAIENMDFEQVAEGLSSESVELQWRFDW